MGEAEKKITRQVRLGKIERVTLGVLYGVGVMSVALLAPNALKVFKPFIGKHGKESRGRYFQEVIKRLESKGFVKIQQRRGKQCAVLTEKGRLQAAAITRGSITVHKPKRWDEKWRLVVFDVPERRRQERDKLRRSLQNIGFKELQHSVWACPYNCEDIIALLKSDFKMGKEVLYIIADHIENDTPLRRHFDLL